MTKTASQKARAKAARKGATKSKAPKAHPKGRAKKWHLAVGTQWGALSMGSGDTAQQITHDSKRSLRSAVPEIYTNETVKLDTVLLPGSEEIGLLTGTSAFKSVPYSVQPALEDESLTLFPRLSQIAKMYQKYRFRKLVVRFEPVVSVFAEGGKQGMVGLYFDTDALADNLPTEVTANQLSTKMRCPFSSPGALIFPPMGGYKYTRASLVSTADLKTYDFGRLYVTTVAGATDAIGETIGRLYVDYEIELQGQIRAPLTGVDAPMPTNHVVSRFFQANGSWASNAMPLGNAQCVQLTFGGTGEINGLGFVNSGGVFTAPPGLYLVIARFRPSNASAHANDAVRVAIARTYPGETEFVDDEDLLITNPSLQVFSVRSATAIGTLSIKAGTTFRILAGVHFTAGTVSSFAELIVVMV